MKSGEISLIPGVLLKRNPNGATPKMLVEMKKKCFLFIGGDKAT